MGSGCNRSKGRKCKVSDISNLNLNVEDESKNSGTFEALPDGDYTVVCTDAEMKENKSGSGYHISATFEIIEGDFSERLIWATYNVQNSNDTAERIGRAELANLCKAIGIANPQDTDELLNKPLVVKVGIDKKDAGRNKIKAYKCADAPATPATAPAPAPAPVATAKPAPKPATGKKPWQK